MKTLSDNLCINFLWDRGNLKNKKGFTLMELVIVIAIIGVLITIAVPKLKNFQDEAKKVADETNAISIANIIISMAANDEDIETTTKTNISDINVVQFLPGEKVPKTKYYNKGSEFYYTYEDELIIYAGETDIVIYPINETEEE